MSDQKVYKQSDYVPTIDAILSVANLEEVSVKKIRRALQELFTFDLEPHKKDINQVILDRYHKLSDQRANDTKSESERKAEMERQDALLALKLLKRSSTQIGRRQFPISKRQKPQKEKKPKQKRKTPLVNRKYHISEQLASIVGTDQIARPQVVKKLWEYIKQNDLQDPLKKTDIICDSALRDLFKKDRVNCFGMNRDLSRHIYELVEEPELNAEGEDSVNNNKTGDLVNSSEDTDTGTNNDDTNNDDD